MRGLKTTSEVAAAAVAAAAAAAAAAATAAAAAAETAFSFHADCKESLKRIVRQCV